MKRILILSAVGAFALAAIASLVVPIEPDVCPTLYVDVFHERGDALMQQETFAKCFGQMIHAQMSKPKPPPVPPPMVIPHVEAPPVAEAPPPPPKVELTSSQLALIERLRGVVCPRVQMQHQSVHLFQLTTGDAFFSLGEYCPECRYIRAPPTVVFDERGEIFCHDDQPERRCDAMLKTQPPHVVDVSNHNSQKLMQCSAMPP